MFRCSLKRSPAGRRQHHRKGGARARRRSSASPPSACLQCVRGFRCSRSGFAAAQSQTAPERTCDAPGCCSPPKLSDVSASVRKSVRLRHGLSSGVPLPVPGSALQLRDHPGSEDRGLSLRSLLRVDLLLLPRVQLPPSVRRRAAGRRSHRLLYGECQSGSDRVRTAPVLLPL